MADGRWLMNRIRLVQGKGGDLHIELAAILAHHLVGAPQDSRGRLQRPTRRVLKRLARREDRLFADDPGAFDFVRAARAVGDDPVTADELNGVVALVRDAHRIVEEPLILKRLRTLRGVLRFDFDADVVRHSLRSRRALRLDLGFRHYSNDTSTRQELDYEH